MPLDPDTLLNWNFGKVEQTFSRKDAMLYALGIGLGDDPLDRDQLRYVYERELAAFPTLPVVLGTPGAWLANPATTVTRRKVVHGEIRLDLHGPIPVEGTIRAEPRVTGLTDKGADKGALIFQERRITDAADGRPIATVRGVTFARADGGFGGDPAPLRGLPPVPDRAPDERLTARTFPWQALLYRLSGDMNPLHADPDAARNAGYDRPILHGLATFGVLAVPLLGHICDGDPARLATLEGRFSAPVMSGDALVLDVWHTEDGAAFEARVPDREVTVFNRGRLIAR